MGDGNNSGLFGFNLGSQGMTSTTDSQSSSNTFVDKAQTPFLDFLRNTAMGGFGGFQQQQQQYANQLGGLGQQAGMMGQQANPFMAGLQQVAGGNPELLAQQQAQLGSDITDFTQQNLAQANRGAIGAGGLGGGRNQIARGTAIGQGADAYARGLLQLQQQAQNNQLQAGGMGGSLFNQQAGQQLQGLGMQGQFANQAFQSAFQPLSALQQFFGAPTVLSEQESQSSSKGKSKAFSFGGSGI